MNYNKQLENIIDQLVEQLQLENLSEEDSAEFFGKLLFVEEIFRRNLENMEDMTSDDLIEFFSENYDFVMEGVEEVLSNPDLQESNEELDDTTVFEDLVENMQKCLNTRYAIPGDQTPVKPKTKPSPMKLKAKVNPRNVGPDGY